MLKLRSLLILITIFLLPATFIAQESSELQTNNNTNREERIEERTEENYSAADTETEDLINFFNGNAANLQVNNQETLIISIKRGIQPDQNNQIASENNNEQSGTGGIAGLGRLQQFAVLMGLILIMVVVLFILWRRSAKRTGPSNTYIDKHPGFRY